MPAATRSTNVDDGAAPDTRGITSRLWTLLLSLSLQLAVTGPAGAMVVAQRDFPELVARAEQIVVGTVTDIRQEQDESGAPTTLVTLSDLAVLKGDAGPTLTLRFYGGTANGVVVHIPDMPTFTVGERALLFVAGNGRDVCPLVGVWQGRFRVRFDATRNTEVVDSHDHKPVTALAGRQLRYAPLRAAGAAMTLDEFRQLISDELAHPQAASEPTAAP
jgi:hypothetical protein